MIIKPKGYVGSLVDVVRSCFMIATAPYILWSMLNVTNNDPKFRVTGDTPALREPSKVANVVLKITFPLMVLSHMFTIPLAMFAFVMSPVTAYAKHKYFAQQAIATPAAIRADEVSPNEGGQRYDEEEALDADVGHYGSLWRGQPESRKNTPEYEASNSPSYTY